MRLMFNIIISLVATHIFCFRSWDHFLCSAFMRSSHLFTNRLYTIMMLCNFIEVGTCCFARLNTNNWKSREKSCSSCTTEWDAESHAWCELICEWHLILFPSHWLACIFMYSSVNMSRKPSNGETYVILTLLIKIGSMTRWSTLFICIEVKVSTLSQGSCTFLTIRNLVSR